jgi:hypothetical protein
MSKPTLSDAERKRRSEAAKKTNADARASMTPEERSEEMRRRVMLRWQKQDPLRSTPTRDVIELVHLACGTGATIQRICEVLDIPEKKFRRFMGDPDFKTAVQAGRQYEHDALVNKLVEVALKGNVAALCFALKSRHNYNDTGSGNAVIENKVAITFQLPGALSPEKYLQTLSATAEVIKPEDVTRALAQPGIKRQVMKQLAMEEKHAEE